MARPPPSIRRRLNRSASLPAKYMQIAEIISSSTNTVGTLMRRAKQQMEKTLNKIVGRKDWFFQIVFNMLLIVLTICEPDKLKGGLR